MSIVRLKRAWLMKAKRAFTTRRVPANVMRTIVSGDIVPQVGNLVLAIVDELGSHRRVESPTGRRKQIFPGDLVLVCYANRYAPDQFEAVVPDDLGPCDLIAGGGVAGREVCRHEKMMEPTRLLPIGLVGDADGKPLNIKSYAVAARSGVKRIPVVLVFGTAMNSGKTMTAGSLIRGLATAGYRVAGIKATGTGSGGDLWFMSDMGASFVADFTDTGLPSTYLADDLEIENNLLRLVDEAAANRCEIAVVEIADGLQHKETAVLAASERLRQRISGVVFASYDSLGAQAGVAALKAGRHNIFALSGQISRSPLAMREASTSTGIQIFSPFELQAGILNESILSASGLDCRSPLEREGAFRSAGSKPQDEIGRLIEGPITALSSPERDWREGMMNWLGHNGPPQFDVDDDDFHDNRHEVSGRKLMLGQRSNRALD